MTKNSKPFRLDSIDVFRALTMFLMIFVNDFWTLEGVPQWMQHSKAADDALGLSDVVFPAFLFIVGLSIPFAIDKRWEKGDSSGSIAFHILERTFALLVMGIFIVNLENAYGPAMSVSKPVWSLLMVLAFFLIWNAYKGNDVKFTSFKIMGYIILAGLAVVYKGGEPGRLEGMGTHWYGILGLIGWSYLICAFIYFFTAGNLIGVVAGWIFLVLFNLAEFAGLLEFLAPLREKVWIVGSGSMPAFVMAGVSASVIYKRIVGQGRKWSVYLFVLLILGVACLAYGFGTRPFWGISKIWATPAWVGICSGISFLAFTFFFWLVDVRKKKNWANVFRPAGTATLTCYLIPYVWYAVVGLMGIALPLFLRTGMVGLLKSLCFALLVIVVTGLLNLVGLKLKI